MSGGDYYNDDYRTAVIDVCHNNAVGNNFYHMSNYSTAYDLINTPLDQVWSGKKSAEEVIKNEIMPNLTKRNGQSWKVIPPAGRTIKNRRITGIFSKPI